MPTKLSDLLKRGRCVNAWAQRPSLVIEGFPVGCLPSDPAATCWCLVGALRRLKLDTEGVTRNLRDLACELFPDFARIPYTQAALQRDSTFDILIWFNDHYATHEQVIQLAEEAERRGILTHDVPVQS